VILSTRHRITNARRMSVECDADGCPESMYLEPGDIDKIAIAIRRLGWKVDSSHRHAWEPMPALCPKHGEAS
jgi:methionine aminopeptidase